jgi:formylmethanofuran dehydrogenase subunit B
MPKSRKAEGKESVNPNCSFCGTHKDDVPLMVSSNVTQSNCCSWCALGMVEQTFKSALTLEKRLRKMMADQKAELEPKIVVDGKMPDKVDVAVEKALKRVVK